MVVALVSVVGLLLAIWAAHVVIDLVNARRDYEFYRDVARLREHRREAADQAVRHDQRKKVG